MYKPAPSPRVGTDPFLARISGWVKRENPKMHYIINITIVLKLIVPRKVLILSLYDGFGAVRMRLFCF